jgi:hypothetical protein
MSEIENPDGTKQTTTINANYIPPEHRATNVGNIVDNRSLNQRIGDANFSVVYPKPDPHDAKIDALEREVARKKRDEEFSKLRTTEERALYTLREQREADFQGAERKAAEKQWLKDQSEPLNRLNELREAMASADAGTFSIQSIVKIDQARKQFSTYGADLKVGQKMLSEIEQHFAAVIEQEQLKIAAQLAGLENKKSALLAKLQTTVKEPEESEFDRKLREAVDFQRTLRALEDAGRDDEAQQLVREAVAKREARKAGTANE